VRVEDDVTYFFFSPEGLAPRYVFDAETVNGVEGEYKREEKDKTIEIYPKQKEIDVFIVKGIKSQIRVVTLTAKESLKFYKIKLAERQFAVLTAGTLLQEGKALRIESEREKESIYFWPEVKLELNQDKDQNQDHDEVNTSLVMGIFKGFLLGRKKKELPVEVRQIGPSRYTIKVPDHYMDGIKELILAIQYRGDIAHLFIDGDMIADNFCNGQQWETGLRLFENRLAGERITLLITPLKEGSIINVESTMAGRKEEVEIMVASVEKIFLKPVYEYKLEVDH
jgi:hypothetical protein